ncbi:hypothetical protein BDV36DRAFT_309343 [Aspergillus pseudocaelatus]|uniref:Zn(2)-C6 fungal-type domain-containing protein n=1 Tax=Aspergillus pseudocaelatus TaxID=1825620 RepID=A0ABQ6X185_9EURO|nr:hypothetical protein BDV36DRAFT_309343 [Aspergillus pseudocaelatus]
MRRGPNRERLRARQACRNCRKKKTRCPSERPACSSCVRLKKPCIYDKPQPPDRLADLEKKVDLLMGDREQRCASDYQDEELGSLSSSDSPKASSTLQTSTNTEALRDHRSSNDPKQPAQQFINSQPDFHLPKLDITESTISNSLDLYFERFHRQPIWCFDRQDLGNIISLPSELVYSILQLTARFSMESSLPNYGKYARWSIMFRLANETTKLETIESTCLLACSAFIDGDIHNGQFYLGLGLQLCRSTKLDSPMQLNEDPASERKKRLIWSIQALEQFYSEEHGMFKTVPDIWRPYYLSDAKDTEFPRDSTAATESEIGIWSLSIHFGWVWSRVRVYISDCSRNKLMEPWRIDSAYSKVLADLTDIENKAPLSHRYNIVRFYERQPDEVKRNRDYWMPWLKMQFIWHSILTVMNHPFLYITASQCYPDLAIPNTFWRKSSELVLLHATWIVRTIDMIYEKQIKIYDHFLAHAAAIAATVHLYFSCATDARLSQKSRTDFAKCQRFLESFSVFSPACKTLALSLDRLVRIALDNRGWERTPSRIQLSVPLMWAVLQFSTSSSEPASSLSSPSVASLIPSDAREVEPDSTLEISTTDTPPSVIVDPTLGHDARLPAYKANSTPQAPPNGSVIRHNIFPPTPNLFNTSWTWADLAETPQFGDTDGFLPESSVRNTSEGFSTWWNLGNL